MYSLEVSLEVDMISLDMAEHSSQGANPSDFTFTYGRSTAGGNSGRRVLAEHEGGPKTPSIAPQTLVRTQSEALQVA